MEVHWRWALAVEMADDEMSSCRGNPDDEMVGNRDKFSRSCFSLPLVHTPSLPFPLSSPLPFHLDSVMFHHVSLRSPELEGDCFSIYKQKIEQGGGGGTNSGSIKI